MEDSSAQDFRYKFPVDQLSELTEFNNLVLKAQKRAVEDKLTQYYKRLIDEKMYDKFSDAAQMVLDRLDGLQDICNNIVDHKQGKNAWCFFTVNFKEGFSMNEAYSVMEIFRDKCKFVSGLQFIYSVEQRAEEGVEVGTHVHILFEKSNNPPSKIQRAFTTYFFDKYVGTHAALDYKYGFPEKVLKDKVKYIMGIKKTEKMAKVHNDRRLKDAYGIPWYIVVESGVIYDMVQEIEAEQRELFNISV